VELAGRRAALVASDEDNACSVTMVPAALSAIEDPDGEWVCLECEELDRAE
jgi:hypothetical protein